MNEYIQSEIIELLKILGDSTRLGIITSIRNKKKSSSELQNELDKSQATISKHLGILEKANLVKSEKEGREKKYQPSSNKIFRVLKSISKFVIKVKREEIKQFEETKILDTLKY